EPFRSGKWGSRSNGTRYKLSESGGIWNLALSCWPAIRVYISHPTLTATSTFHIPSLLVVEHVTAQRKPLEVRNLLTLPDSMSGVEGPRGTRRAADSGASCHGIAGG